MSLCSEALAEAFADVLVAFLQLVRLDGEELEVSALRLVGGILHARVPGVESLAVCHDLLDLTAEGEVGEEPGGVRMGGEAGDGAGRNRQRHPLLRIDSLYRIPLLHGLVEAVVPAVDGD